MYPAVDAYPKPRNLLYMIEIEEPEAAIVFCNTRTDTSLVTAVLNRNGYDAELLNGDLPQKERERVMAKVKRGEVRFMVATDIAARGIDISDLVARHQLLAPGGPGRLPPPRRPHRPHRQEGDEPLPRVGRRHPHAHGAPEEVRHRVRGEEAPDAGGGAQGLDRPPRRAS